MTDSTSKPGFHYVWVILIGCCCAAAGGFGAVVNVVSVYLLPVVTSLQIGPGDWMIWLSTFSIAACITLPLWGKAMNTKNFNVVTTCAALITIVGYLMFAFGSGAVWYWIWGAVMGCGLMVFGSLVIPTLLGNWVAKGVRGRFLGVATAFTGIGTFVWAPLFTYLVQAIGWSATYIVNAVIMAVLLLPFTMFLFKFRPSDKGLHPYGIEKESADSGAADDAASLGVSKKEALRSVPFYLVIAIVLMLSIGGGFNTNMAAIAVNGLAGLIEESSLATIGAWMISVAAAGNVISKIVFGTMNDKLGIKPTFYFFAVLYLACFAIWMFAPSVPGYLVAAFCFGTHNGIVSVGVPIITRMLFGNKEYAPIFSTIMTVNALIGGFAATIISYIYQITGSYEAGFGLGIVMVVLLFVCFTVIVKYINNATWMKKA